jgi:PiT family inorganic phosphate transporter
MVWIILLAALILAFSNGANDNFKGVATLYGSGAASYRHALAWATMMQLLGSLLATVLAGGLVKTFSAKGLVPDSLATAPHFLSSVTIAATATVLLATFIGMPVSTTHALTGALVGAGLVAVGVRGVNFAMLGKSFFLPLLASPVLAMSTTMVVYPIARFAKRTFGIKRESCVCVGTEVVPLSSLSREAATAAAVLTVGVGSTKTCAERYEGRVVGVSAQRAIDTLHFASGAAICFARALNDTPKIVAVGMSANALGVTAGLPLATAAMAFGGVLYARRVAETIAKKITPLNAGQGFVANFITAAFVMGASRAGLPVSTTHVSTSAVFGIGVVNRTVHRKTISNILAAWVTTLPVGAFLGAVAYFALN